MIPVLLAILLQPFIFLPAPSKGVFAGKTAIVTGGNTGLGLETARHLLKNGCTHVIIASRDVPKGEAAKENLLATDGVPKDVNIEVWSVDLSKFDTVKAFAAKANALKKLDYLFLNAGSNTYKYQKSADGWEQTLQVNVLSTSLLGLLLLPKLVKQAKHDKTTDAKDVPRIVVTTSGLHAIAPFEEKDAPNSIQKLNTEETWNGHSDPLAPYMASKLFDLYITRELAKLVPERPDGKPEVIINCVDPGLCKSELQREGLPFPMNHVLKLCGRTTEYGSRNLIAAALGGPETQGAYFADGKSTT